MTTHPIYVYTNYAKTLLWKNRQFKKLQLSTERRCIRNMSFNLLKMLYLSELRVQHMFDFNCVKKICYVNRFSTAFQWHSLL